MSKVLTVFSYFAITSPIFIRFGKFFRQMKAGKKYFTMMSVSIIIRKRNMTKMKMKKTQHLENGLFPRKKAHKWNR